jgi:two-component system alkaline phosphatase synthesis response regulator PhoP
VTRILVVEDEPGIAFGLELDLETEGYGVEIVPDGNAAIERGRAGGFDLILLDLMLPGKDGFEVCRELRRSGCKTPIIMLTAKTQEIEKVTGLDLGADDYVTKPFSPKELRSRIKAVLRRATGATPEVYRFGEMEVDFTRCELRRAGKPVGTTPLEFRLLTAFIRNRGRTLTRDKLLDEAWGRDFYVTPRVVDNHIVALRKKLEPDPSRPHYLVNVRGMGYRFDG